MRWIVVVLGACGRVGFDAAPGDAAGGDGPDATALACPTGAFCDGFEDPALAVWTGTQTTSGGTVVRDAMVGYRGTAVGE